MRRLAPNNTSEMPHLTEAQSNFRTPYIAHPKNILSLLASGAAVGIQTMKSQSDLFEAVLAGDLSLVIECITAGCDVDREGVYVYNPLYLAITNGEVEIACYLIPQSQVLLQKTQATPSRRPVAL